MCLLYGTNPDLRKISVVVPRSKVNQPTSHIVKDVGKDYVQPTEKYLEYLEVTTVVPETQLGFKE